MQWVNDWIQTSTASSLSLKAHSEVPVVTSTSIWSCLGSLLCGLLDRSLWFYWLSNNSLPKGMHFINMSLDSELSLTLRKQLTGWEANLTFKRIWQCSLQQGRWVCSEIPASAMWGCFCFQAQQAHPGKENALWTSVPAPGALALPILCSSCAHAKTPGWCQVPHQDHYQQDP